MRRTPVLAHREDRKNHQCLEIAALGDGGLAREDDQRTKNDTGGFQSAKVIPKLVMVRFTRFSEMRSQKGVSRNVDA